MKKLPVYWLMQFENNLKKCYNVKENQSMWLKTLNEWKEKGIDCAIVTIVKSEGSTPRGVGSKMVVNALTGEIAGSVGGGLVEYECMKLVEEAIQQKKPILKEFSLKGEIDGGSDLPCGGICGGSVTVLIEPVLTGISEVIIFGGGHIGEKISKYCEILNMPYRIFDNREEFSSAYRFPSAIERICKPYESLGETINLTCASYCVILTHGHEHDEICLDQLLKNRDVPYIGMIGSQKKVKIIVNNIRSRNGQIDDRVYSPIGLKIANNLPEQIALAIMAQIIMLINKGTPEHYRFPWHEEVSK
jgi:xanthine dehydrogenase accessory factor